MLKLFRIITIFVLLLCAGLSVDAIEVPSGQREEIQQTLEKILLKNIIPFWMKDSIHENGDGYSLNHDINGEWQGSSPRNLVAQARIVWFFSTLHQSQYGEDQHLKLADQGYEFLVNHMRDKSYGGYYWQVSADGEPLEDEKHLYGQSFALYALSEYYKASKNQEALDYARELVKDLDFHAHDTKNGGYNESFKRNWLGYPDSEVSKLSAPHDFKLMNTHLHLMEAFTTYLDVSNDPLARERLTELVRIETNAVVRKTIGACTDKFFSNWMPAGPEYNIVSYGHDIENVWLVMEACDVLGVSDGPYLDLYYTLFDYSLKYGYDQANGGFYNTGAFNKVADDQKKVWWVQAECLVSALKMYQRTQDEKYFDVFHNTLDWINTKQVDWKNGDWFSSIDEDGTPSGGKAHGWKTAYHNGRAMLECLEIVGVSYENPGSN